MSRYTLIDLHARQRRVALRDESGGYHIAILDSQIDEIGIAIDGPQARPGYALLCDARSGRVMHAVFRMIHCTQDEALSQLHPV